MCYAKHWVLQIILSPLQVDELLSENNVTQITCNSCLKFTPIKLQILNKYFVKFLKYQCLTLKIEIID